MIKATKSIVATATTTYIFPDFLNSSAISTPASWANKLIETNTRVIKVIIFFHEVINQFGFFCFLSI